MVESEAFLQSGKCQPPKLDILKRQDCSHGELMNSAKSRKSWREIFFFRVGVGDVDFSDGNMHILSYKIHITVQQKELKSQLHCIMIL